MFSFTPLCFVFNHDSLLYCGTFCSRVRRPVFFLLRASSARHSNKYYHFSLSIMLWYNVSQIKCLQSCGSKQRSTQGQKLNPSPPIPVNTVPIPPNPNHSCPRSHNTCPLPTHPHRLTLVNVDTEHNVLMSTTRRKQKRFLDRQPRDVWLDELGTNIRPWEVT